MIFKSEDISLIDTLKQNTILYPEILSTLKNKFKRNLFFGLHIYIFRELWSDFTEKKMKSEKQQKAVEETRGYLTWF